VTVNQKPGSGRKPTVVTSQLANTLRCRIKRNPVQSMRGMAKELNVSEASIRRVFKYKLNARSFARTQKFLLTDRLTA
jgi:hypothetical protein